MNSKDLLSINEAFANATSKVTTDQPAKKDEVVTENIESAEDFGDNADRWATSQLDDEINVGDEVEIAVDAPEEAGKTGIVSAVSKSGASLKVGIDDGNDERFVVVDRKDVVKAPGVDDDISGAVDDADWMGDNINVNNIMDNYENSLTSSKYKVREKAETGKDFKKPDEKVSEVDSKTQRPKGEVSADEKSKDVGGAKEDLQEPVEAAEDKEEKKSEKKKKSVKESINTSNKGTIMSEDKSIFDKLYESVMGEDDKDFELGIGDDELAPDAGDEFGDEGGEEVTVTLTPDQAAALKAVVDQLPSDDEDLGDIDAEDPLADTDELEDSVQEDTTQTSDGKKPGVDPSDGGGKTTDPAADSLGGKSSGDGAVPVTDKEGTEQTGDGKKPGVAKNSGKPGKQAV